MRIIHDCSKFYIEERTAVAIGKFDGIHVGHQKLLKKIIEKKQNGLAACVFTFDPPPDVLFGKRTGKELTTREEKRILFERIGVDILIEFPLNKDTAAMLPEDFVKCVLTEQLKAGYIAAGTDISFGKNGEGRSGLLVEMQGKCGFEVEIIDKVLKDDREISSTYVREAVAVGDMELAKELLGEPFTIYGEVLHGNKLGRTLGMPTINQLPPENKLLPPFGVYYSEVDIEGNVYKGITNIGLKPTVNKGEGIGVETFIYNFNQEVYGDMVTVKLFHYKRPEQKFGSVEELKTQIKTDVEDGLLWRQNV